MGLIIKWSNQATLDLEVIFEYYNYNANLKVAQSIIKNIVTISKNLKFYPNIGKLETTLKFPNFELKYIIINNYKLIYSNTQKGIIIHTVFDTRQNPELLVDKFKNI